MNEPHEGFLDDDFARFRTQRLKKKVQPQEPTEDEPEMFFGTTSGERDRIREQEAKQRTSDTDLHQVIKRDRPGTRPHRRQAPPLPTRPPTGKHSSDVVRGRRVANPPPTGRPARPVGRGKRPRAS